MVVKNIESGKCYDFIPETFSLRRNNTSSVYEGRLFKILCSKYILFSKRNELLLGIRREILSIDNFEFYYFETTLRCHLILKNEKREVKIHGLKSFWEFLPNSTYDHFDKVDDNRLYNLYSLIKDYKDANSNK